MRTKTIVVLVASVIAGASGRASASPAPCCPIQGSANPYTVRASLSSSELEANASSGAPAASHSGRWVAFSSSASNLVAWDGNGVADVFVRDTAAGTTLRMSVTTGGIEGTAMSGYPAVSGDGRFVAFWSMAALVPDDTNGMGDVYLRDRDTDADGIFDEHGAVATTRVSVADDESQGNGGSGHPDVSDDGRYVAFDSWATNLVTNDSNTKGDVFVRDRVAGTTVRVSVGVFGQGNGDSTEPAMSSDGQTVGFQSFASNLAWWDTNSTSDVFVRSGGTTVRASLTDAEGQYNVNAADPSISADGSRVAFEVGTGVFVRDISAGSTTQASLTDAEAQPNNQSSEPSISADGTRVAFRSLASNLVAGDGNGAWDVFVRNLSFGTTRRVSVSSGGTEGNAASGAPSISGDGLRVAFESQASNLVSGDLNGARDVFVRYG